MKTIVHNNLEKYTFAFFSGSSKLLINIIFFKTIKLSLISFYLWKDWFRIPWPFVVWRLLIIFRQTKITYFNWFFFQALNCISFHFENKFRQTAEVFLARECYILRHRWRYCNLQYKLQCNANWENKCHNTYIVFKFSLRRKFALKYTTWISSLGYKIEIFQSKP